MNLNMGRLRSQLILHESVRLLPYDDATGKTVPPIITIADGKEVRTPSPYRGKLTIGIGRNLDGNPFTPAEVKAIGHDGRTRAITIDQAILLLDNDIAAVGKALDQAMPWWRCLDEIRARVLVDLCFNMGLTTLLTFKNTLASLRMGNYEDAAIGLEKSLWYKQVGNHTDNKVDRGERLVAMVRTGKDWIA